MKLPAQSFLYITVLSVLISACTTVGPNYQPPKVLEDSTLSNHFIQSENNAERYSNGDVPENWWQLYNNPELNQLIQSALENNTDIQIAIAHLDHANAALDAVLGQDKPTIGTSVGTTYGHISGVQELQPNVRPKNRWSYSGGVSVSYQIDWAGQLKRHAQASQADVEAVQAAYRAALITVVAETTRAYTSVCNTGMQRATTEHSIALQNDFLTAIRTLQQAGRATALDITRANAQLEQLKSQLPSYQAQQYAALYRLAALTGKTPDALPESLLTCRSPLILTEKIPTGNGRDLLRRRPDIQQAERKLASATAQIGIVTAELYPKISLGLSAASAAPMTMFGEKGSMSWSLGPLISWTVPNTGIVHAKIKQAEADTQAALSSFNGMVLNALRETETALATYAQELDKEAYLRASRDNNQQAVELAQLLFKRGKTDYLTVLDAERSLANAENALVASQDQLNIDQINLFVALGGGWENVGN